jgi:exonuclease I
MVLASQYLINDRKSMPSFKLTRVAKTLGLEIDESQAHDALFDAKVTKSMYEIITTF